MGYNPTQIKYIEARLCLTCRSPIGDDRRRTTCLACGKASGKISAAVRDERERHGQCRTCGKSDSDGRNCSGCRARFRRSSAADRERRIAAKQCLSCSSPDVLPQLSDRKNWLCERCYFRGLTKNALGSPVQWEALKQKLIDQDYRCVYSGDLLTLGVNASLDHIQPVSRFPELRHSVENLQWVTWTVNTIKRSMDHETFIALIQRIATMWPANPDATSRPNRGVELTPPRWRLQGSA